MDTNQKTNSNWYVFYTVPRAEKVIQLELLNKNYDVFLPMTKEFKVWKNRQKKWIDRVLFPGYIFVNTQQYELYKIKQLPKVVTYIHISGKPTTVSDNVIQGIKKMISLGNDIAVLNDFCEGEKVKIVQGPLSGHEGILIQHKGKTRFGIQLNDINQTVSIDICINSVEKINVN
jgi:transcription antitermination factor NusG